MTETFFEIKLRSIIKTIVWRIIATLVTLSVVYFFTHKIGKSLQITFVAAAISMAAYYIHERIWNKINWGKHI